MFRRMLSLEDINSFKDYTLSGFPAMQGRLAVRTFDPKGQRDIIKLATDIGEQMPKAVMTFAETSIGDLVFQAANKGMLVDNCLRTQPRIVIVRDTPTATNYFYLTQYAEGATGHHILNDITGEPHDEVMLPDNFARVAEIVELGRNFAIAVHMNNDTSYKPTAGNIALQDVFGFACALKFVGHAATRALSMIQAVRESEENPSGIVLKEVMRAGSGFFGSINDSGSAMSFAEQAARKMGLTP